MYGITYTLYTCTCIVDNVLMIKSKFYNTDILYPTNSVKLVIIDANVVRKQYNLHIALF